MTTATQTPIKIVKTEFVFTDLDGDVVDNQHFRWCADDPLADDPTYDDFEIGPEYIIPAGTTVTIRHLWGWDAGNGMTAPKDYVLTTKAPAHAKDVVARILADYHNDLQKNGGSGRFYFIEQVRETAPGEVEIIWGT